MKTNKIQIRFLLIDFITCVFMAKVAAGMELPEFVTTSRIEQHNTMEKLWAFTGRLFQYQLSNQKIMIESQEILGQDEWLLYDKETNILIGIPEEKDLNQEIKLKVLTSSLSGNGHVTNSLKITVVDGDVYLNNQTQNLLYERDTGASGLILCDRSSLATVATIALGIEKVSTSKKVAVLLSLSHYLHLPPQTLRISSLTFRKSRLDSALAEGRGNCEEEFSENTLAKERMLIEWVIGCGNVNSVYLPSLQSLEQLAMTTKSTSRDEWVPCVYGWHVANRKSCGPYCRRKNGVRERRNILTDSSQLLPQTIASTVDSVSSGNGPLELTAETIISPGDESDNVSEIIPDMVPLPIKEMTSPIYQPEESDDSSNEPPVVKNFLPLRTVRVGDVLNFTIPSDTFFDSTDGNTRNLQLELLEENGNPFSSQKWIKFDSEWQILYALPRASHVGRHAFLLRATDSKGKTAQERVRLRVLPVRKEQREFRFVYEWSLVLDVEFWSFTEKVDSMLDLLSRIAVKLHRDEDTRKISLTGVHEGSVMISWINNTFPINECPVNDIRLLQSHMITEDKQISETLILVFQPYRILRFFSKVSGACLADDAIAKELSVDTTNKTLDDNDPIDSSNNRPVILRPIGEIRITVGNVLDYIIPEDTFDDKEDGSTRNLRLIFLSNDSMTVARNSWIRLDAIKQKLYGLPMKVLPGTYGYQLAAVDSKGQLAHHRFDVIVMEKERKENHEFIIAFKFDFDQFMADVTRQVDVAWRIARVYGDSGVNHITVRQINSAGGDGSTVEYAWSNQSIPFSPCPVTRIGELLAKLVTKTDDISEAVVQKFETYEISRIVVVPLGPCNNEEVPRVDITTVTASPDDAPEVIVNKQPSLGYDNTAIAASTSAVIILIVIIMLVVCVACWHFRKGQRQKYPVSEEKGALKIRPGVPIIFVDELQAGQSKGNALSQRPSIVAINSDVRLPAPPEYPKWGRTNSSRVTTPLSDHKIPLIGSSDTPSTSPSPGNTLNRDASLGFQNPVETS